MPQYLFLGCVLGCVLPVTIVVWVGWCFRSVWYRSVPSEARHHSSCPPGQHCLWDPFLYQRQMFHRCRIVFHGDCLGIKEGRMGKRRRNPVNITCRRRFALFAGVRLRGGKNGRDVGMRLHAVPRVATRKGALRWGRSKMCCVRR